MGSLNRWSQLYGIRAYIDPTLSNCGVGADTASAWNSATVTVGNFVAGAIGVDTSKYGIPLTNFPTFDSGTAIINTRKAVGTSYRQTSTGCLEYQLGARTPQTTYEADATYKIMALFCQLLFQGGATEEATTPFLKTFIPYAEGDAAVVAAAALIKKMSDQSADSHVIGGAIIRTLNISGEEGQPIKVSAEFTGYNMVSDYDYSSEANILEFDTTACLMMQNLSVKLAGTAVNIPKFDLSISNNAVPKYYNTNAVTKYVLGDFTCTGNITIPWASVTTGGNAQIDNFTNGTDCLLEFWSGNETPSATGDVKIQVNARYTGATVEGDDEIVTTLPFEAANDGTNNAIRIYVADACDRGIA